VRISSPWAVGPCAIILALVDREAILGDLVTADMKLVETHISWVLIGRSEVWKLKKPMSLGFLDFSSVERRKAACEAEVELNRRLAPEVYLGVVPITRDGQGRLVIDGAGELVDWAVHMRRLPDRDRVDLRLAEGRLTRADITRIAERIAEFHARARVDDETLSFGRPEAITTNVRENFSQTRDTITRFVSAPQAEEVEGNQLGFVADHEPLFAARIEAQRVRDGHGDLRLEHVYLSDDGEVTIIDCIEFNDRFRYADVAADLAFLAMDLSEHGEVGLSEQFVADYAQASGDYDLYSVLDFYEGYRAYVRGKIAAFVADGEGVDHERRERAELSARHHFLLALASDRRALLGPSVVAVGGIIASGKSTLAAELGAEMSAPIVDADRTRKQMIGIAVTDPMREGSWQGAYDPAFTREVYAEVLRRAEVVLRSGRPVIVDASFRSRALRARVRALAEERGVPFRMVECRVAVEICRERLRERAKHASVSDGRLEIFDDFVASWEPVDELSAHEHLVVDTAQPLETSLAELRRAVRTWPEGLGS